MRLRSLVLAGLLLMAACVLALPGGARAAAFPDTIALPNGWQPEGVATGRGIYAGSLANGAIYAANLRTGAGEILYAGQAGRSAAGLAFDRRTNYIYAAGASTGMAYVYDAATGAEVGAYTLATGASFINDAIVTRDAVYFTDSTRAAYYQLPLGPGGALPAPDAVQTIPLTGDFVLANGFNANGIEATPDGRSLIIVNSTTGTLYLVDAVSGVATAIDLGGATVTNGDGLLLQGRTLYVVRNQNNEIAVIRLAPDYGSGTLVDTLTSASFDVPTTLAAFGNGLYAVNARFGNPSPATAAYSIVRLER